MRVIKWVIAVWIVLNHAVPLAWSAQSAKNITAVSNALSVNPFIYNGKALSANRAPWQVVIYLSGEGKLSGLLCAGTVVAPHWILTAAHCFWNPYTGTRYPDEILSISGGSAVLTGPGENIAIKTIVPHPKYEFGVWDNDIALIELQSALAVPAIALATPPEAAAATKSLRVSGWGKTEKKLVSNQLLYADIPVLNRSACDSVPKYIGRVTDRLICAGIEGSDSCKGDSGGPLFEPLVDGAAIQHGVTVAGEGCGVYPALYSRVVSHQPWILIKVSASGDSLLDPVQEKAKASTCTAAKIKGKEC